MSEKAYHKIEVVGTSKNSIEEAVQCAITAAHAMKHRVTWFEVIETRGHVQNAKVAYYQVTLKLGLGE